MSPVGAYALVALLGAIVGCAEIVSRYPDRPWRSLRSWPGVFYVLLNVGVSALALFLVGIYRVEFSTGGLQEPPSKIGLTHVLASGLGSVALLRSSFGMLKVGGKDFSLGLAPLLQTFLDAVDRAIGRVRAQDRMTDATTTMRGLDTAKCVKLLPQYCVAAVPSLGAEEKAAIIEDTVAIELLLNKDSANPTLSRLVALALMNHIGPEVLKQAVDSLGDDLKVLKPEIPAS